VPMCEGEGVHAVIDEHNTLANEMHCGRNSAHTFQKCHTLINKGTCLS